jgi:serine protease Do
MDKDIFIKIKEKFFIEKLVINQTFKIVALSVTSTLLIIFMIMCGVWYYRGQIFKSFANKYAIALNQNEVKNQASTSSSLSLFPKISEILPEVFSNETLVENAVSRANPAVVAITISKEVPKYKTSYQQQTDPFQQFFGGGSPFGNLNFQIPIQTPDGTEKQQVGSGSGFIVSPDGMIVTNKHVVADKTAEYAVFLSTGKKYTAKVLARDSILDVAVIKIDGIDLPYLNLADSSKLKLGQSVIAIGNALGQFQNTISVGVISGLSRSITAGDGMSGQTEALSQVIQTDAAINPGNSGGPLLNLSGEVVGVDTAIVSGSQNIGFALPINSIKSVINSVKKTGKIVRPYVGVRYKIITPAMKDANKLAYDYGIIVAPGAGKDELAVIPGSPADKAGILENDIILEIDGVKIDHDHDMAQIIRQKNLGDVVKLKISSKGVEKTVTVILQAAPQE